MPQVPVFSVLKLKMRLSPPVTACTGNSTGISCLCSVYWNCASYPLPVIAHTDNSTGVCVLQCTETEVIPYLLLPVQITPQVPVCVQCTETETEVIPYLLLPVQITPQVPLCSVYWNWNWNNPLPVTARTDNSTGACLCFVRVLKLHIDACFLALLLDDVAILVLADAAKVGGHFGLLQNPLQEANVKVRWIAHDQQATNTKLQNLLCMLCFVNYVISTKEHWPPSCVHFTQLLISSFIQCLVLNTYMYTIRMLFCFINLTV